MDRIEKEHTMQKYYVQLHAENYFKNVSNNPDSPLNVHDKFLYGLDREQFTAGFADLLSLMRQLYSDIACDPASFGMILKELVDVNDKSTDYTGSHASLLRVPNLLLALGVKSQLQADMSLAIDGGALADYAKQLKVTALPLLLTKLKEYGFEISDFGKTPKTGDVISLSYTHNRCLIVALKAMAEAHFELRNSNLKISNNDYFYMMHSGLLENEIVKEPKLTSDFLYNLLNPIKREYAKTLHESVADITKQNIRKDLLRNNWACTYTGKKSKKVLMSLFVEQSRLSVKLNLQHINMYIPLIKKLPEKMLDVILNKGWACGRENCNPRCSGGFAFEIDDKAYDKCHCGSFVFHELTDEDIAYCQQLVRQELKAYTPSN